MNGKAKWVGISWMAVALLPLMVGVAGAINPNPTMPQTNQPNQQDEQVAPLPTPSPTPDQAVGVQPKLDRAKDLIGARIVNDKGERLGTVADIVLTPERDAISYVVLSHGGTWGMGEKYFAVPWSQFGIQAGENGGKERHLILKNVVAADLERATGFDKDNWPTTASDNWLGIERDANRSPEQTSSGTPAVRMLAYQDPATGEAPRSGEYALPNEFAPQPYLPAEEPGREAAIGIEHQRLSKLLGTTVRSHENEDLGKLDNVVIDVRQGKVAFGIVSLRSGFLGLSKDFVAVPWSALDLTSEPGVAKLDTDKQTLMAMTFNEDNFPNLADPQYSRQLHERFQATPYSGALGYIPGEEKPSGKPPHSGMTAPKTENTPMSRKLAENDKNPLEYNLSTVRTIRGTVQSVDDSHRMAGTSMEELRLHVKTDDGNTMMIHVGPRSYVDRQNISFREGDAVTITGSLTKAGRHEAIVASQIQTADKTLRLRDQSGKPLWSLEPSGSERAPSSSGRMQNSY